MLKLINMILLTSFSLLNGEAAYAQVFSTQTQKPVSIVGSRIIAENRATDSGTTLNFDISPENDYLICKVKGIYFVSASIQVAALVPGINGHLGAWFEQNHKAISSSCSRLYVTEKSPIVLMTIPFIIQLEVGDTIGTRFASSGPEIGITSIDAPSLFEPQIPGYTLTLYKVAD